MGCPDLYEFKSESNSSTVLYLSSGEFFKVFSTIDSSSGEMRSFPMHEIVRLEKTDRKTPKGRGGSPLGEVEGAGRVGEVNGTSTP